MAQFKGQSQGHANFDYEYLVNGESTNMAITNTQDFALWLSIVVFIFDLVTF